tara:strand:+ start:4435 stop:5310 length:876 start_codon:yes stop_codon:yes gene_type:complete
MKNNYPIYVVSKNRWESRMTMKHLDWMGCDYYIVIEQSQWNEYAATCGKEKLLVLPQSYIDDYDTWDNLGDSKSKGPGAARNFAWDHSISNGDKRHWVMDDNFEGFYRLNRNRILFSKTPRVFLAMEDFADRYVNAPIVGPNYACFVKSTDAVPPYILNTRIYSCLLIENAVKYRWRGRYNEDTDLSLRVLKDGLCTVQFNAFLAGKLTTQKITGGNTDEFYSKEGTYPKSKMLEDMHPDVAKVVWKFNRWHHHVDYKRFRKNTLIRHSDYTPIKGINEYGMRLVDRKGLR